MKLKSIMHISIISLFINIALNYKALATEVTCKTSASINGLPEFNAASALYFIQKQVNFGPRVPNTHAHTTCKRYLKKQLQEYGAKVYMQKFQASSFNNKTLQLCNIIGSFNPSSTNRILLAAHWDTRPFADKDTHSKHIPILGANDGASGVGVLLEVARIISLLQNINIGIDIIFFDGEDYGPTQYNKKLIPNPEDFWCLGSQYWAKNTHIPNYTAQYGILLDMVGCKNATFYKEGWSIHYADKQVAKIWNIAHDLGHANYFIDQPSNQYILDDHLFINKNSNIPIVNIIDHSPHNKNCFGTYHHTHYDNLDIIDKNTLKAVGETIMQVIYTTLGC